MTEPETPINNQYVGFWRRGGALIIDYAILTILTIIIISLALLFYGNQYIEHVEHHFLGFNDLFFLVVGDFLISWVFPCVAIILFWVYKSQTPGKMVISAIIVDAETGGKISVGQCIGRYFAYLISALPLGLGFIWVAFDKKKQGWHDKLAGTVVVRTN